MVKKVSSFFSFPLFLRRKKGGWTGCEIYMMNARVDIYGFILTFFFSCNGLLLRRIEARGEGVLDLEVKEV